MNFQGHGRFHPHFPNHIPIHKIKHRQRDILVSDKLFSALFWQNLKSQISNSKYLGIWAQLLNLEKIEEIQSVAALLINVGLAEQKGYGHLQLDPALPSYMLSQITETDKEAMQVKWAEVMVGFAKSYT